MPYSGIRETAISKPAMASAARRSVFRIFPKTSSHAGFRTTRRFLPLTVISDNLKSPLVLLGGEGARVVYEHRAIGDLFLEVRRLPPHETVREIADLSRVQVPEILDDVAYEVDLLRLEDGEVGFAQRDELAQ